MNSIFAMCVWGTTAFAFTIFCPPHTPPPAFTQQEMPASMIGLTLRSCSKEPEGLHPVRKRKNPSIKPFIPFSGFTYTFFFIFIKQAVIACPSSST
jgi:hypothetical protein